jgi:hypothetical protein
MTSLCLPWAIGGGIVLGVAYALSPLSAWFAAAVLGLFACAGRGLAPRERRWVFAVLGTAVVLRVAAVAVLFLTSEPDRMVSFFWDGDGLYLKQRSLWLRNILEGVPLPPVLFARALETPFGWTSYLYVLAYLQYLLGPAPYGLHLVNIAIYTATAILLYRLARASYGRESAFIALTLLLFFPTLFAWSVSPMKEAPFVLLVAVAVLAIVRLLRDPRPLYRGLAIVIFLGALATVDTVRRGGTPIMIAGLAVACAGVALVRRPALVAAVPVLAVAAGLSLTLPSVQERMNAQFSKGALYHVSNARTKGHAYRLLDARFYPDVTNTEITRMTAAEKTRFVVRAAASFIFVPLPWHSESRDELVVLPQQVVWYALQLLAVVGLVAGMRRDAALTCALAGVSLMGAAVVGLSSGNVGTMVRHRDSVVPFIICLSGVGIVHMASVWLSRGRVHSPLNEASAHASH